MPKRVGFITIPELPDNAYRAGAERGTMICTPSVLTLLQPNAVAMAVDTYAAAVAEIRNPKERA